MKSARERSDHARESADRFGQPLRKSMRHRKPLLALDRPSPRHERLMRLVFSVFRAFFGFFAVSGGMRLPQARRAKDNSPALQRWGVERGGQRVPQGRKNLETSATGWSVRFLASLRDSGPIHPDSQR